jgi:multimeric flavodoxin WrbA
MKIVYISGSPRKKSNTDYLLNLALSITGGQLLKLSDYGIAPCRSCWACQRTGQCAIDDSFRRIITPALLDSDAIVLGSPVYFNNVSGPLKTLMDRTFSIKGGLKNKIGGAIVAGRRYGLESALTAMQAFFLKHEMIPANSGVCGLAYNAGDIEQDQEAIESTKRLAKRIQELDGMLGRGR